MVRFTLRIPDELYGKLVALASQQERSLNAQVLYILKTCIDHEPVIGGGLPVELSPPGDTVKQEGGT